MLPTAERREGIAFLRLMINRCQCSVLHTKSLRTLDELAQIYDYENPVAPTDDEPTDPMEPTEETTDPTEAPTDATVAPTQAPTQAPTGATTAPTTLPTQATEPMMDPTMETNIPVPEVDSNSTESTSGATGETEATEDMGARSRMRLR